MQSGFVNKLNNQQLILRIKFFGGQMYGEVNYFCPEWGTDWH